jgi:hypothetical protein
MLKDNISKAAISNGFLMPPYEYYTPSYYVVSTVNNLLIYTNRLFHIGCHIQDMTPALQLFVAAAYVEILEKKVPYTLKIRHMHSFLEDFFFF